MTLKVQTINVYKRQRKEENVFNLLLSDRKTSLSPKTLHTYFRKLNTQFE